MTLTKKELDFCKYYTFCRNHREAAAKAGYVFPERTGTKLLAKKAITDEIEARSENLRHLNYAADGFRRIAFGSIADAVKLISQFDEIIDVEKLDLFMVSEIKINKNGGIEVKFFDRIKALEALASITDTGESNSSAPFIDAIFKGAEAISGDIRSEFDEF